MKIKEKFFQPYLIEGTLRDEEALREYLSSGIGNPSIELSKKEEFDSEISQLLGLLNKKNFIGLTGTPYYLIKDRKGQILKAKKINYISYAINLLLNPFREKRNLMGKLKTSYLEIQK